LTGHSVAILYYIIFISNSNFVSKFVALTSRQNYTTFNHTSIILDFDRELHYVSLNRNLAGIVRVPELAAGEKQQPPEPRVMIKSALHIVLPGTHPLVAHLRIMLHRIMVFGARSFRRAFESQSQSNTPSKSNVSMMVVDNLMRSMNKIHMILPLLCIGLPLGAILLAPVFYPLNFVPYVALIVARCLLRMTHDSQLSSSWTIIWMASATLAVLMYASRSSWTTKMIKVKKTSQNSNAPNKQAYSFLISCFRVESLFLILLHISWWGVSYYVDANADMAIKILLAPWQQVINLDRVA
jgi:hypothetical protein